jgi:glutamyl-Q tRNA(Asp) synthetase
MIAHDMARREGGKFFVRMEDLDSSRSKKRWENQILDDLDWLGLSWDRPVVRQSESIDRYKNILIKFKEELRLFECNCSRRDIKNALSAPHESEKLSGPDGLIYPGTCRENKLLSKLNFSNVLRMGNSLREDKSYSFCELGPRKGKISFSSEEFSKRVGDVVLWRRGYPAYHLACVIDDSEQKITHVVRGLDLFDATKIHTVLNSRLGLNRPIYFHHKLICDENGKRLAKRNDSKSLHRYRQEGFKASEIKEILGFK